MALRESVRRRKGLGADGEVDLDIVTGRVEGDADVPHGALLAKLAECVARWQWDEVAGLRRRGVDLIGAEAVADAILVAAGFNGITRVADAIGIRLDPHTANVSVALRAETGIDAFAPTEKWAVSGEGPPSEMPASR